MCKITLKQIFLIISICLFNKQALSITGHEISLKVSDWLIKEGVIGTPVFSKNTSFQDCNNDLVIEKMFQSYKTIKVHCLDENGFELVMRVRILKKKEVKEPKKIKKLSKVHVKKKIFNKKNEVLKLIRLKRSLEKNDIIEISDIETVLVEKKYQTSFFSTKDELVGRKIKKNLKMGQILHPRHLFEMYEINNGDIISIVSNIGNASVTATGEAQDSGNLDDLIKVKNLRSGKIIKGYIKKNKIIKVFR